jgi:hypothetical protein
MEFGVDTVRDKMSDWWETVFEMVKPCPTKEAMIAEKMAVEDRLAEISKCLPILKRHLPDMPILSILYYVSGHGCNDSDLLAACRRFIKIHGLK